MIYCQVVISRQTCKGKNVLAWVKKLVVGIKDKTAIRCAYCHGEVKLIKKEGRTIAAHVIKQDEANCYRIQYQNPNHKISHDPVLIKKDINDEK